MSVYFCVFIIFDDTKRNRNEVVASRYIFNDGIRRGEIVSFLGEESRNEIFDDSVGWLVEKILVKRRGTWHVALLFSRQAKIECGVTSWFSLFLCLLRNRSEIVGVVSTSHDPNYLVLHILFGSTRGTRETGYFCFIMLWCAYIVVCQSGFSQILSKSKANFVAIQVFLYSLISWEENVYKYLYIYIHI